MERGKGIFLVVICLLLIVGIFYLRSYSLTKVPLNAPDENMLASLENNKVDLTDDMILTDQKFKISEGMLINLNFDNRPYSFKVNSFNGNKVNIEPKENNILPFVLENEKKIDLNNDKIYDLELNLSSIENDQAEISFKNINESVGIPDLIDSRIENVLRELERDYNIQSYLILIIFVIFLVLLVLYLLRSFFIPKIQADKNRESEKPSEAFEYLVVELEKSRKRKDKIQEKKLYKRIMHLYNHLPLKDKKAYKLTIIEIRKLYK